MNDGIRLICASLAAALALLPATLPGGEPLPPPRPLLVPLQLSGPPGFAAVGQPSPPRTPALLHAGQTVTLRVRQVLPGDGLSPGERLLNGLAPVLPGDRFLAEVLGSPAEMPILVAGVVTQVEAPGWFRKPGRISLELLQLVEEVQGRSAPVSWRFDTEDRRLSARMGRVMLNTLFALEGAGAGAAVGASLMGTNIDRGNLAFIGGGAGAGLLLGIAYAGIQQGEAARLEPGDTFQVVVGTCSFRPVPDSIKTVLFPAPAPDSARGKK